MSALVGRADIPAYFLGAQRAVPSRNLCGPEGPKRLRWMGLGCRYHLPLHCVILENSMGNMRWELEETQEMTTLCNINKSVAWKLPKNKVEDKWEGDTEGCLCFSIVRCHVVGGGICVQMELLSLVWAGSLGLWLVAQNGKSNIQWFIQITQAQVRRSTE